MPFQKGHTQSNTGRTHWKKGQHSSIKTEFKKGHKVSIKELNRLREMAKKRKGIPRSEITKKKISKANKGKRKGKLSQNWKGGISYNPYPDDWTDDLKKVIRKRDNYICQICGIHQDELKGWTKKLDVHHIDYDKDNLNPKNLISLCRSCHVKTNFNREYWKYYFKNSN